MIAKRKVINLSGGFQSASERLSVDVTGFGVADIRAMMVNIVGQESANQARLGNPAQITEVDGNKTKPVTAVQKRVVVLFGITLPRSALSALLNTMIANIDASTEPITGALRSASSWEFRHIRNGRRIPLGETISFGPRDFVVLRPRLGYASAVNKRVAAGSDSLTYNPANTKRVAKRNQRLGFMARTARDARRMPEFVQFSVTVGMTTQFAVAGEVRKIGGTAYLMIAPRRRRTYRG